MANLNLPSLSLVILASIVACSGSTVPSPNPLDLAPASIRMPATNPPPTAVPTLLHEPTPDIEATISARVAAALEAVLTGNSGPTPTPTQLPKPTLTSIPSATPTPTPILTPTPSPTPAVPTVTPTAVPTPTIPPTLTPTLQPTATPSAIPTPTSTPIPTPLTGTWMVQQDIHPLDDSDRVIASLASEKGENRFGERIGLVLRCSQGNIDVIISWGTYLGSDNYKLINFRVGQAPATSSRWSKSNDGRGTLFFGQELIFIQELLGSDQFVAQVTPYGEAPITAVFELHGIENVVPQVLSACQVTLPSPTPFPTPRATTYVTVKPTEAPPGSRVNVVVGGFSNTLRLSELTIGGVDILPFPSPQAFPEGTFIFDFIVPDLPVGTKTVQAKTGTHMANVNFTITNNFTGVGVVQLIVREISPDLPDYERADWRHWIDADGDCQNTRHEVLIEESLSSVTFNYTMQCTVATGQWLAPFSGATVTETSKLDVAHLVPLRNAHTSGGWAWDADRKQAYANLLEDSHHLVAITASANLFKGASGPEQWMPPDESYWCRYATDWILIKAEWGLSVTSTEWIALDAILGTCEQRIAVELVHR